MTDLHLLPSLLHRYPCLECAHVVIARTERAAEAAMQDHADHVNSHADKSTDPHFEDARLDALIVS